ncbi:MAG: DUF1614 domain-containing protein [Methanosarcinales archaeon]|nr:DUF1614 domain-containing protein [Methanosarcinales archaeon]
MNHRMFYNPFNLLFMLILAVILSISVAVLFLGVISTAFTRIGFSWSDALILLLVSLLGSSVNIPVANLESRTPVVRDRQVRVFGITYTIPFQETIRTHTTLAVNLGGAVVPTLVSLYLVLACPGTLRFCLAAILLVALVTNRVARPVRGVGIVTPALVPPLVAALGASILVAAFQAPHEFLFATAYTGGAMGTLLGADLLNFGKIRDLGAPVASIGGAGTFDGVFLSGIIAVLLV